MAPRNLFAAIAMGACATLAHPFTFAARCASGLGRAARRVVGPGDGRSKVGTTQWNAELLKRLDWRRFEEVCAGYFEAMGFSVRVLQSRADGGLDIGLCAAGADSASIIVQCKVWNAYRVGIQPVRALQGAMSSARMGEGMMITSGRFTPEAVAFAAKGNIQLIDGPTFLARLAALVPDKALALLKLATQGDFLTPTCPACQIKMISRKSTQGGRKFWGCTNYPKCKQTISAAIPA